MNQINLIGKVKGDMIYFQQSNGEPTVKFKLIVETNGTKIVLIDCIAWKIMADKIHDEVRSNDLVSLTGKLNPRILNQNGIDTQLFEVIVDRLNLILPEYAITRFD